MSARSNLTHNRVVELFHDDMSFNDFALKKIMVKREMHTIAFPKEQEN